MMIEHLNSREAGHQPVGTIYRSGQRVPQTGLYRVIHYQHRLPHDAVLTQSDQFPQCNKCGLRVAFTPSQNTHSLLDDEDFALQVA